MSSLGVARLTHATSDGVSSTDHRRVGSRQMVDSPKQADQTGMSLIELLSDELAWSMGPSGSPESDEPAVAVRDRVAAGFSDPVDFPPLTQAVIPGDRVVLAVDATLPDIQTLLGEVIEQFDSSQLGSLEVVLSEEASDDLMMDLANELSGKAGVSRHASTQRDSLMYLIADQDGNPVYLNRRIVDADFVLPVVSRFHDWVNADDRESSLSGNLFPLFADSASQRRHREHRTSDPSAFLQNLGMTLGVQAVFAVSADGGGHVAGVDCGSTGAPKESEAPDLPSGEAEVILAVLDGGQHQQSWTNLARAAAVVDLVANDGATVVLWSSISKNTPVDFQAAMQNDERETQDELSPTGASDTAEEVNGDGFPGNDLMWVAGRQLAKLCDRCRVMVRTHLDDELMEELGVGVVHGHEELERICSGDQSVGVLCGAQFFGARMIG